MQLYSESFSPGLRFTEWQRRIEEIAGMDAEVVAPGESSFRSSIRQRNLGPLTILEFDVQPYQVRLAQKLGSAPRESLVLWLSIDGTGWVEQGGVTTKLDPTILCVYGANRPRTFAFTTPSRGVAVLLPLNAVRQALQGWELALPLNIDCTRGAGAVLADVVRSVARHADDLGEDIGVRSVQCSGRLARFGREHAAGLAPHDAIAARAVPQGAHQAFRARASARPRRSMSTW